MQQKAHAALPNPNRSQGEHPSPYFVQKRADRDELTRLHVLERMFISGVRGVWPDQPDPVRFQRVLDVGCGAGGWLMELARNFPDIEQLVGVDMSECMLSSARTRASAQHLEKRVSFQMLDVLRQLDFFERTFDLVNERLGASYLRTWQLRRDLSTNAR